MTLEIVLYQPQIPQNTGNVLRTASAVGANVSLIRPLGFQISDRLMKRAGLGYFDLSKLKVFDSWDHFTHSRAETPIYFFSSKASSFYSDATYTASCSLVFGSESSGLPEQLHQEYAHAFYKIPMKGGIRCLNLASSVAIVTYESLRQTNFTSLEA